MGGVARSKITVPGPPTGLVRRPALLDALDRGAGCPLTLVCAPPGYGKTVLLAQWAAERDEPCAWVSLDEEDDDPRRLWSAVVAALADLPGAPSPNPLHRLVVPRTSVGVDFLTELLEALDALPGPVRVVLDDAHHLRSAETLRGLRFLLRNGRSSVRLVLASRFDLLLPVARLRMEERLCELRADQLTFTPAETVTLARLSGLRLSDRQAALLTERTGGWVAGIRLAALPLRDHPDPDAFLHGFSGDERPVADYLAAEVTSRLTDEQADLLRRASIADQVPAALAVELSGRSDAAEVLSSLARSTGLVAAVGPHRTEFRVQELMRSYLSVDLQRHGSMLAPQLHHRAAVWWADHGRPVEALQHAGQAGDETLLTTLLHDWTAELVARGEFAALRRALDALGPDAAGTDPWLSLAVGQIHLAHGDLPAARADVRRADAALLDGDQALAVFATATQQLTGTVRRPLPPDPPSSANPAMHALALTGRGVARLFTTGVEGPVDAAAALDDLEAALVVARNGHLGLLEAQCLWLIGVAALTAGFHPRAAAAAEAAIEAAAADDSDDLPWTAAAHAVLAHTCLVRGTPVRALEVADDGLRIAPDQQDPAIRFALQSARGGAFFDLGDRPTGLVVLQEAHADLGGAPVPAPLAATAALLEHRAALLLGFPAAAATTMKRLAARGDAEAELTLLRAWSEAAGGSPRAARSTVAPLLEEALQPILPTTVVEAWLVHVWAALRLGDRTAARQSLQTALLRAAPMDALRPFTLAPQGIRVLLVDQLGGASHPASFAFRCLAARRRARHSAAPSLSAREREVLVELVSLSNLAQIADGLAVSVNTVKSHVRAIYGKLGVNTRRTAVLTALEQGLLT